MKDYKAHNVATILAPGIRQGDFKIQGIEEGGVLELTVYWPSPLFDIH